MISVGVDDPCQIRYGDVRGAAELPTSRGETLQVVCINQFFQEQYSKPYQSLNTFDPSSCQQHSSVPAQQLALLSELEFPRELLLLPAQALSVERQLFQICHVRIIIFSE
jgi:hypothetical protein